MKIKEQSCVQCYSFKIKRNISVAEYKSILRKICRRFQKLNEEIIDVEHDYRMFGGIKIVFKNPAWYKSFSHNALYLSNYHAPSIEYASDDTIYWAKDIEITTTVSAWDGAPFWTKDEIKIIKKVIDKYNYCEKSPKTKKTKKSPIPTA
jgi:hypothetical protein